MLENEAAQGETLNRLNNYFKGADGFAFKGDPLYSNCRLKVKSQILSLAMIEVEKVGAILTKDGRE
jgi:hypothetical protein